MKLLHYTVRQYILYSIVVLLISIPAFYWLMHTIVYRAVDTALLNQKKEILAHLPQLHNETELIIWKKMNSEMEITSVTYHSKTSDSFYSSPWAKNGSPEEAYRHLEMPVNVAGKNYKLTLHSPLAGSNRLLFSIILIQSILLLLLLIGLVVINRLNTSRLWSPFYKTLQQLKGFDLNKEQPINLPEAGIEEFNELNKTVKDLTAQNLETYRSQKEFTENASHEMQTPLAVFKSKLELLMQTQPLTNEQAELISDLEDTSERLARLNNSLLLLTRIENNQYHAKQKLDFVKVSKAMVEQLKYLAEGKEITIKENYNHALFIETDNSLLEILLSNLITNAIRYSKQGGTISITNTANQYGISNTAINGPLESSLIFNRFHKAGNDSQSIGLGLAIVKKICQLQHYTIEYSFADGMHTFSITFPAEQV